MDKIEKLKTIINGHLNRCNTILKHIQEDIDIIQNEDDALFIIKQHTHEAYKQVWLKKYYKAILETLKNAQSIEEINVEIMAIEKRLLSQPTIIFSTNSLRNVLSFYEHECLQNVHHVLTTAYNSITKEKNNPGNI